jgi:hypothetical protein
VLLDHTHAQASTPATSRIQIARERYNCRPKTRTVPLLLDPESSLGHANVRLHCYEVIYGCNCFRGGTVRLRGMALEHTHAGFNPSNMVGFNTINECNTLTTNSATALMTSHNIVGFNNLHLSAKLGRKQAPYTVSRSHSTRSWQTFGSTVCDHLPPPPPPLLLQWWRQHYCLYH